MIPPSLLCLPALVLPVRGGNAASWCIDTSSSRRNTCPVKRGRQGAVQDERVVGRLVSPGGSAAEWHARYAVLDEKRYEKRVVQYAARHAGQNAPGGRSPEQHES